MSEVGTVQTVLDTGDIRVRYPSGHVWTMNVASVVKVNNSHMTLYNNNHYIRGKINTYMYIIYTGGAIQHWRCYPCH